MVTPMAGPRACRSHRDRGFTLIELMIVLVVMAIIVGIGAPSMRQFLLNQRVRNAAFDLGSALLLARSEATKRNQDVVIASAGSWEGGWTITSGGNTLATHGPIADITVVASHDSITFRNSGRLLMVGAAPTFTLNVVPAESGVAERCLSIDLSGKVKNEC